MRYGRIICSLILFIAVASSLLKSCRKKDAAEHQTSAVSFQVPQGFPAPKFNFSNNPLTKEGIELGRHLFYDGLLSKDGNFPCASCHQQFASFSTFDHDLSHGFNNAFTTRNAQSLANLAWQSEFHHDGGINNLEVQPLAPITAPNEMGETIDGVVNKLRQEEKYKRMFKEAFGDEGINSQRLLKALSQFMVTMVSANSKYDQVKAGKASFTATEQSGYQIFQAKCATCHAEPLFTDNSYRNNGLALNDWLKDFGRMRITNNRADSLKFKVPSLRNVDVTGPYTHDGRLYYLRQMIEHYRTGIQQSPTLDPLLSNRIALTNTEVDQLIAFLKTLTDETFLKDSRFSQPQ
jgi:cytochrome c peroxidase